MRYRYLVGLVSILFVLTNCSSSNKQDPMLNVISTLRTVVKERNNPTPIVDPTKVITREMLDASSQPLILIRVPTRQIIATLGLFPGETLGAVWLGADGSSISTDNGILRATRGMSYDLVSADTGPTQKALSTVKAGQVFAYERSYKYIVEDNRDLIVTVQCELNVVKSTSVEIFKRDYPVMEYVEACNNDMLSYENRYWREFSGKMRNSLQWQGTDIGYIMIETLI